MSGRSSSTVTVGRQGRIVLPVAVRRSMGIEQGDELVVRAEGSRLVLEPREMLLETLRGELREARGDRRLVDELLDERRREAARER